MYEESYEKCGLRMNKEGSPWCTESCALFDEDEQECIIYSAATAAKEYFKQKHDDFLGEDDE